MSSFTDRPKLSPLDDGKNWEILEDFEYYLESDPQNLRKYKKGSITDGASTGIFRFLFPQWGKYTKIILVHDDLYQNQKVPRSVADKEMLDGMRILGVNKFTRYSMYLGVRLGGWWPYYNIGIKLGIFFEMFGISK